MSGEERIKLVGYLVELLKLNNSTNNAILTKDAIGQVVDSIQSQIVMIG